MMPSISPICKQLAEDAMRMSESSILLGRLAFDLETTGQDMTGQVDCFYPFKRLAAEGLLNMARSLHRLSWRFSESAYKYAQKARLCVFDGPEKEEPISAATRSRPEELKGIPPTAPNTCRKNCWGHPAE